MQSIHLDPKITTDLQIDWRRPDSGQTADLFADLLADRMKQQANADRRTPAARRPHPPTESVSGKPPRPVIVHLRTVRGEAKEIDEPGARLGHEKRGPAEETCTETGEDTAATAGSADTPKEKAAEAEAASDAPSAEQPAAGESVQGTDEAAATTEPVAAVAVVPTQQADQVVVDGEAAVPVALPVAGAVEGEEAAAAPTSDPQNPSTDEAQDTGAAAASQQALEAMAAAGLPGATADLKSDGTPAHGTAVPAVVTQPVAMTAVPTPPRQLPLQISLIEKPIVDLTPAPAPPQPGKSSMDVKLRSGAAARAQANAPAPDPQPSSAQASGYAPQAATPQPTAMGAFDGFDDTFEQPFSSDGSGPGWTLHLAQGAASRRADFVAQLRQHLQNLPAHEQVAVHIQRAVREGTGRVSVQLSPAELGRIHVKLEIDEDKRTTATVTVERPSTLELLQRDIKGLERALHSAGLSLDSGDLSFSLGHGSEQEFAQDLGRSAGSSGSGSLSDGEPAGELPGRAGAPVMDTAAGMVDVQV
jgi:flagellar hook-length control protein FliK